MHDQPFKRGAVHPGCKLQQTTQNLGLQIPNGIHRKRLPGSKQSLRRIPAKYGDNKTKKVYRVNNDPMMLQHSFWKGCRDAHLLACTSRLSNQ